MTEPATPAGGTLYVLDTDTLVDVLRRRADVVARLDAVSPDDVRVSAASAAELYYGALRSRDPAGNAATVDQLLAEVGVLAFGRSTARVHARLRDALRAAPIGAFDLLIAATAVAHGARARRRWAREGGASCVYTEPA